MNINAPLSIFVVGWVLKYSGGWKMSVRKSIS